MEAISPSDDGAILGPLRIAVIFAFADHAELDVLHERDLLPFETLRLARADSPLITGAASRMGRERLDGFAKSTATLRGSRAFTSRDHRTTCHRDNTGHRQHTTARDSLSRIGQTLQNDVISHMSLTE